MVQAGLLQFIEMLLLWFLPLNLIWQLFELYHSQMPSRCKKLTQSVWYNTLWIEIKAEAIICRHWEEQRQGLIDAGNQLYDLCIPPVSLAFIKSIYTLLNPSQNLAPFQLPTYYSPWIVLLPSISQDCPVMSSVTGNPLPTRFSAASVLSAHSSGLFSRSINGNGSKISPWWNRHSACCKSRSGNKGSMWNFQQVSNWGNISDVFCHDGVYQGMDD